ncbi:MAG: hypothetical protein ACREIF_11780 [Chthoniobacterales bacterium]
MERSSTPTMVRSGYLPALAQPPIQTYRELQQQIRHDLRAQHREWVQPNGESPMCDYYERRLAELIQRFQSTELTRSAHPELHAA